MKNTFSEFVKFSKTYAGLLAEIATVASPLFTKMLKIIPLPSDPYGKSVAPIAIPLTTMASLFTLLYTFVQRNRPHYVTPRRAALFFLLGMILLLLFFAVVHFEYTWRSALGGDSTDDFLCYSVTAVPLHCAIFMCWTHSWTVTALIEFKRMIKR